jgi:hypothetical protein
MVLAAGAAVLALAACGRSNGPEMAQNGVIKGPTGLQVNALSAAGDCLSPSDQQRSAEDFTPDQRRQIVGCVNAAMARQVNTQLPKQIDAVTRLDRLSTEGPLLTYHYTVLRPASQLPPNAGSQLDTQTRRMACAQPQMRQTLEMGGAYAYRWVDNQGALIHEMRIDAC